MNSNKRSLVSRPDVLRPLFLHAVISYKKPIRAQSEKIPDHVFRPPSPRQERVGRVENEEKDTKKNKE